MERFTIHSLVVFSISLLCYYNSLDCGFVFDDVSAIKDNKDLRPDRPISNLFRNDFWGTPMHKEKSHKSYRPLCVLTFRWNYFFHQLEPMGYHLVNMFLHAIVTALYLRLCHMFLSSSASFVAAILFAVHPIHTEAVTGTVGRAEMLAAIFFLMAFFSYSKATVKSNKTCWRTLLLTVVYVVVATLCKEQGITVVGICTVYELLITQKLRVPEALSILGSFVRGKPQFPSRLRVALLRISFLLGTTAALMFLRIKVMDAQLPVFTNFDNPASQASAPSRHFTYNYLLSVNAWLLLCPIFLCCDWTMGTIPLIKSLIDARNLATLSFYFALITLTKFAIMHQGKRSNTVIMALALAVIPFLPASNLFFPVGFVVAERILYTPSMGFSLLVALGFDVIIYRRKSCSKFMYFLLGVLILTHSTKTIRRNFDWKDEYAIFMAGLSINQRNAKLFNNVGHSLEAVQEYDKALKYFRTAASVQPDDIGSHINVGRTYNNLNLTQQAEQAYKEALKLMPPIIPGQRYTARIAPQHLRAYVNLGTLIAKNNSRLYEADQYLQQAIKMRSDYTEAYINRGDILMKLNKPKEAEETYRTALRYDNDNADIYYNLGVVLLDQNRGPEALGYFNQALKINPDHRQTLFNSAVLMQEIGDPKYRPTAYKRLQKLQEYESDNEKIYFNLGMLSMDDKKFNEAEQYFIKAIQIKEDFRSAVFNIALMLVNDLKRPLDAVPYLQILFKHHPDHIKGHILMGDININHLKDPVAAEKNFLRILEIEPRNVQAYHNLCVAYVEQGYLLKAEKCLTDVAALAPHETYIVNHLNIVRSRIQVIQEEKMKSQQASHSGNKNGQADVSNGKSASTSANSNP